MAEKSNVLKQSLKHKGFFNYSDLYNFCYNWFKDNQYALSEDVYTEKLSGFGKEILIEWTAAKKVSDYFKEKISIKWHILGMNDAEIAIGDKKEKTNKGEIGMKISADLISDYEDNWNKTPFYKFLRGIYDKYIIKNTADLNEDRLEDAATDFVNEIKSFLKLEGIS